MQGFNLARKLFDIDEADSEDSDSLVINISSDEGISSDGWECDYSTDTEQLVARIEKEVIASPMLIGGRIMTVEDEQEQMVPGPSSSGQLDVVTPKLDHKNFDREMCYATPKAIGKSRIELCKTLLPVLESPMSPPQHERIPR